MMRILALAILAALAAARAQADPVGDCAALLPDGSAPVYLMPPSKHTELCHAPAYGLSHDDTAHEPRWVAWVVTAEHLRMPHEPRTNKFDDDTALPPGAGSTKADYVKTGMDKGHQSNAEDNAWSPETEQLSFLMSNMIPQCKACNEQAYRYVENWTRVQAMRRGQVYVIAGPVFGPRPATIGRDQVWVPSASWKLVLDLFRKTAWGFIVPNDPAALAPGSNIRRTWLRHTRSRLRPG